MEIAFCLILFLFCCILKPLHILYMLLFLLPIHGTIKEVLFASSGMLFASWKEIAILIMLVKLWRNQSRLNAGVIKLFIVFFVYLIVYSAIGLASNLSVISTIKQLVFPIVIVYVMSLMRLNKDDVLKIIVTMGLGCMLIDISGLIDFLSPTYRMLFRNIMHVGYLMDSKGNVYYDTSSFKIMGIDRACGLMAGGPNQFGVYNAVVLLTSLLYWLIMYNKISKRYSKFLLFVTVLSLSCLLISFSRAGCAIVGIAFILYMYKTNPNFIALSVKVLVPILILIVFVSFFSSTVADVFLGTFTGKEASSAARASMTQDSMQFLLQHPLGFGIGAVNYTHQGNHFAAFAESSIINFGIDIGLLGIFLLVLIIFQIYRSILKDKNNLAIFCSCAIIANLITSFVSVNPYENPYIYLSWIVFSLPLAYRKIP